MTKNTDNIYLGVWVNENQTLTEDEWHEVSAAIEEMLSTHPKFHTFEFEVNFEEVP